MFLQPDWWEVTKPGVGTNRYAYSFGDPVNKMDPGGNQEISGFANMMESFRAVDGAKDQQKAAQDHWNEKAKYGAMQASLAVGGIGGLGLRGLIGALASRAPSAAMVGLEIATAEATGMTVGAAVGAKVGAAAITSIDDLAVTGIKVTGSPQFTQGAGGLNHAAASAKLAVDEVNRVGASNVAEVFFDTGLGKIVDGVASKMRPDVALKMKDGSIGLLEATSPSQTVREMQDKIGLMSKMVQAAEPGISVSGWARTVSDILRGQ
jgi:hypothetical protein